jgi:hypothetical protein
MLAAITAVGAAFRFYNLAWGAPYYHFHIDEHFVLAPANTLRTDPRAAAMGPKFFMYGPVMMQIVNVVRGAYEALSHPLDLAVPRDEVTYMVLARAIAAAFGTATIVVSYAIATRIGGRLAGLLSAFFLAFAVLHLRDSHFATTDMPMTFFCALALWWSVRLVERGDRTSLLGAGASVGAAAACKYTGLIVLGAVGVAYLLAPGRPRARPRPGLPAATGAASPATSQTGAVAWIRWVLRGMVPIVVAAAVFFILNPLIVRYPGKFLSDFKEQVTDPLLGAVKPIFFAQFSDIPNLRLYWFTNLLWWSLGPMLEVLGLAGVVWLFFRRDPRAVVVASFAIIYYAVAGHTVAPMIRYTLPLAPTLAVAAGVLSADWLKRSRSPILPRIVVGVTVLATALYAVAYMNVFRQPDSRVEASRWLIDNVPRDAKILVEPSQNTPPMGGYFTNTSIHNDYVLWGGTTRREAERERNDYYHLYTFDAYRYLYADRYDDAEKRRYIDSRLAQVDWIVIDDTYTQWYQRLPGPENALVKQHYKDLFDGKLGFALVKTFKVYPRLFAVTINDDDAEFSFRLFDHPRVFVFRRFAVTG